LFGPNKSFAILYKAMSKTPEAVTKNNFVSSNVLLWGLLTQTTDVVDGTCYGNLDIHFLRLYLERIFEGTKFANLSNFLSRDELVAYIHKKIGKNALNKLRLATFQTIVLRLCSDNFPSPKEFGNVLLNMKKKIRNCGFTELCNLIAPSSQMNDDQFANLVLAYSKRDEKRVIFPLDLILLSQVSKEEHKEYAPPGGACIEQGVDNLFTLNKIIDDNLSAIEDLRKKYAKDSSSLSEEKKEVVKEVEFESYNQRDTRLKEKIDSMISSHIHYPADGNNVMAHIAQLAIDGTNYIDLDHIIKILCSMNYRKSREFHKFILRFSNKGSDVYKYYSCQLDGVDPDDINNVEPQSKHFMWMRDLLRALKPGVGGVADVHYYAREHKENVENDLGEDVSFTPYVISQPPLETISAMIERKENYLCKICTENTHILERNNLHGDSRHWVCMDCVEKLDTCPFCRKTL